MDNPLGLTSVSMDIAEGRRLIETGDYAILLTKRNKARLLGWSRLQTLTANGEAGEWLSEMARRGWYLADLGPIEPPARATYAS